MDSIAKFIDASTICLDAGTPMVEAIALMRAARSGAILVSEAGVPSGMFTERDLLMKVDFSRPEGIGDLKLKDVMSGKLLSAGPDVSCGAALALMNMEGFRHLPIVEGGRIAGLVSLRKLLGYYVSHLELMLDEAVSALTSAMGQRDPYTVDHQRRVSRISVAVGRVLGLGSEELEGLRLAAIMHDVGKIEVPIELLAKPGKLTGPEFELIKQHPQSGYEILKGIDFEWPIAEIVLEHHERLDGSGYPRGLAGDEIRREARIIAVADVFEAVMAYRPYRPALGIGVARAEIAAHRGTGLDAQAVDALFSLLDEPGSKVLEDF